MTPKIWDPTKKLERQAYWLAILIEQTARTLEEDAQFDPHTLLDRVCEMLQEHYDQRHNEEKSRERTTLSRPGEGN